MTLWASTHGIASLLTDKLRENSLGDVQMPAVGQMVVDVLEASLRSMRKDRALPTGYSAPDTSEWD